MQQKEKLYKAKNEIVTPLYINRSIKNYVIKKGDFLMIRESLNKNSVIIDCGFVGSFKFPSTKLEDYFELVNKEDKNRVVFDLDEILKSVYKEVAQIQTYLKDRKYE